MSAGRVTAVVVTWNRRALLMECLEHLFAQTWRDMDVLVVDNASDDGTAEALAPLVASGRIACVNPGKNLGGAGGFQLGIRRAVEAGCEYVWVMDDDAMPEPTALEALMREGEKLGEFGWLSGKTLWTDGSLCRMNVQRDLRMRNLADLSQERVPAGAATFVSLLIPSGVVGTVGLPIKEFFIWADDLEYTRRISRHYPCFVVPASVTVHKCATNNGGNISTDDESRIDRYRLAYRNEVYLYRREGARGVLRLILRTPLHILRVLRYSQSQKARRIKTILGGTIDGFSFRPRIECLDYGTKPSRSEEGGMAQP